MIEIALRSRSFEKLGRVEGLAHTKAYRAQKDKLIAEWEKHTGQTWPLQRVINKQTGAVECHCQLKIPMFGALKIPTLR